MEIEIFADKCIGCGRCVENCPGGVLSIINDGSRRCVSIDNKDFCLGCKRCTRLCPNGAIKVKKNHKRENNRTAIKSRFWFIFTGFLIGHLIMAIFFFFSR